MLLVFVNTVNVVFPWCFLKQCDWASDNSRCLSCVSVNSRIICSFAERSSLFQHFSGQGEDNSYICFSLTPKMLYLVKLFALFLSISLSVCVFLCVYIIFCFHLVERVLQSQSAISYLPSDSRLWGKNCVHDPKGLLLNLMVGNWY